MDLDTLHCLMTPEGEGLLRTAASLEGDLLSKISALRKEYPPEVASAAIEQVELRHRAIRKFSRADRMLFTREALEQSTGEAISRYRADRFPRDGRVLDLACGIGGDTIGLASRCFVTAVDRDTVRLEMARHNLAVYGLQDRVNFVCADVKEVELDADAAFLDPSRRAGGRRVVDLQELSPPLSFIRRLAEAIPDSAVKLSPATDYMQLRSLDAEIEFISEDGECKEAVAWFGGFKSAARRATVLPARDSLHTEEWDQPSPGISSPGAYIYEPDACVIRAHLIDQVASLVQGWQVDPQIAYLSSNRLVETPLADVYQVLESLAFNVKVLKERLRKLGAGKLIVKKRGVPFEPTEMARRLRVEGKNEAILILTRVSGKAWAFICKRASASAGF